MVKIHTKSLNHNKNVTLDQFLHFFLPSFMSNKKNKTKQNNETPVLGKVGTFHPNHQFLWISQHGCHLEPHWHNLFSHHRKQKSTEKNGSFTWTQTVPLLLTCQAHPQCRSERDEGVFSHWVTPKL